LARCRLGANDPPLLAIRIRAVVLDPLLISNALLQDGMKVVEIDGEIHPEDCSFLSRASVRWVTEAIAVDESARPFTDLPE